MLFKHIKIIRCQETEQTPQSVELEMTRLQLLLEIPEYVKA